MSCSTVAMDIEMNNSYLRTKKTFYQNKGPTMNGPTLEISKEIHETKYRQPGESFREYSIRVANALKDNPEHFEAMREMLFTQRFLPAGRVQSAMGAARETTPYNCFVMGEIEDSMVGIMKVAGEAAETMRRGGGVGYDFSTLRPRHDIITTMGSPSSGPVSFMAIFDAVCSTISSAGNRRGAQMAVLRVDHPDIEEFIRCKQDSNSLTQFNISVGITDEFMRAVRSDSSFALKFQGRVYKQIQARGLWEEIMRSNWDWAEPGVLFLDTINAGNNLHYCETIAATNPCAEQPLPPYGACLLGSFNLTKYVIKDSLFPVFDYELFRQDIAYVVRAMDNVIDQAKYPLPEQSIEAYSKRRMGLGVTGTANAIEAMGFRYGDTNYINTQDTILGTLRDVAYSTSISLAEEKGAFPLYDERYLDSQFIKTLPLHLQTRIKEVGIRNSHLLSIAPTGTISLVADNVSSGIEPVFSYSTSRTIQKEAGQSIEVIEDYGYHNWGVKGKTAAECTVEDHMKVLLAANRFVDSSVSKTCNVGDEVTWEEFNEIYITAWEQGAKGCTTFRPSGKRYGILNAQPISEENEGAACYFDPDTGQKECE